MYSDINWEIVTGISSSFIALCALIATFWQAYVARRHNRLSVTPYLTTWSHSDIDTGYYSVEILNNGIGPALIKTFQVFVDGSEIKGQESEVMDRAIKILFHSYQYKSFNSFLSNGYMMAAKDKHALICIQFSGSSIPNFPEIDHAINRVRLLIKYESIYKERQIYDSSIFRLLN